MQILLADDARQTLERWAQGRRSSQALALRCRIVLACAEGLSNVDVGQHLGGHAATAAKWRRRFATRRLEGLGEHQIQIDVLTPVRIGAERKSLELAIPFAPFFFWHPLGGLIPWLLIGLIAFLWWRSSSGRRSQR